MDDVLPRETLDWGGNGTALATGTAAMVMMAGDQYSWIKTSYPETDMSTIGFAPLPAGPAGSVSLIGGNMYMVSSAASDDEKEAATYFELWRLFDPNEEKSWPRLAEGSGQRRDSVAPPCRSSPAIIRPHAPPSTLPTTTCPSITTKLSPMRVSSGKVKLQVEPAPAGQDYYAAVGAAVSSILSDQTADPGCHPL